MLETYKCTRCKAEPGKREVLGDDLEDESLILLSHVRKDLLGFQMVKEN